MFITRNRDEYIRFTAEFFRKGELHAGVLIVSRSLPSSKPERVAHALAQWAELKQRHPQSFSPYIIDFL